MEDDKTNEATDVIENVSKSAFENADEDTQTPIKRQKTVSFSENVEQEIEEATEGKSFLKSGLQLFKAKGQIFSKRPMVSPKKRTNEFVFLPNGVLRRETPFKY